MCAVPAFRRKPARVRLPFVVTQRFPPWSERWLPASLDSRDVTAATLFQRVIINSLASGLTAATLFQQVIINSLASGLLAATLFKWVKIHCLAPVFGSGFDCGYLKAEHLIASVVMGYSLQPGEKCLPLRLFAVKLSTCGCRLLVRIISLEGETGCCPDFVV